MCWGDRSPGYFVMNYPGFRKTRQLLSISHDFRTTCWFLDGDKLYFRFFSKKNHFNNHVKEAKRLYREFSKITPVKLVGKLYIHQYPHLINGNDTKREILEDSDVARVRVFELPVNRLKPIKYKLLSEAIKHPGKVRIEYEITY